MLRLIDKLTGYKDRDTFNTVNSFQYEINHSIMKISGSIKTLLSYVKVNKIKYIKIPINSVLNKKDSEPIEQTRHFFDYLMANMIYDIIEHADNAFLTKMYIKIYMNSLTDVIDNFKDYPYDYDDFNRMNYGIFINDSKQYGGNCQIFSTIFELVNFCSKDDYFKNMFLKLCSEKNLSKYYIELMDKEDELLKDILMRKVKNSRLNLIFWIVALDIMLQLNNINKKEYVITTPLLESGFIISANGISIKNKVRQTCEEKTDCVFYICEEHCHVGFLTPFVIFDIDNMNRPTGMTEFINRACDYYNFDSSNLTKYYYNNTIINM